MSFQVTIKEVSIEAIKKGKTPYKKAVVAYDWQGNARTQTIVSFSNPKVFEVVESLNPGDLVDVELTKNGEYTNWSTVTRVGKSGNSEENVRAPTTAPRATGSNYETPQERADNRVRIVRQSSLSNAINTLGSVSTGTTVDEILSLAQQYFDWVYEANDTNETDQ